MNTPKRLPLALVAACLLWVQLGWLLNYAGQAAVLWINCGSFQMSVGTFDHALHLGYGPPLDFTTAGYIDTSTGPLMSAGPLTLGIEPRPPLDFMVQPQVSLTRGRGVLNLPEYLALLAFAAPLLGAMRLAGMHSKAEAGAERVAPKAPTTLQ